MLTALENLVDERPVVKRPVELLKPKYEVRGQETSGRGRDRE